MEVWQELIRRIRGYHPDVDASLLETLHGLLLDLREQSPGSGSASSQDGPSRDPLARGIAVAAILADLRLDGDSIAAGMLSDVVRQRLLTPDGIRLKFDSDIAFLVAGVEKIAGLVERPKSDFQVEDFRKMVLAMAQDIRVILIWLALCVQRMREAAALPVTEETLRLALEVLEIHSPIAHRLGINWIKSEMEDLAFQVSQPERFEQLKREIEANISGGEEGVAKTVAILKKKLNKYDIFARVYGRRKHVYSVWGKLQVKGVTLDELYDLIGYRIIVRRKSDCYRVLGMIHSEFQPIPGRFKDYIALPKVNGYQSLHTVVFGPLDNRIEIQIRTEKMHRVAESGVAAHWTYKGRGIPAKKATGATGFAWLQQLLQIHQNADGLGQFLENVKIDLFPEEIYLFTPAGKIITLPRNATPVDFAYAVHSEVGDRCQGAKVNGRMVTLKAVLHTGDTVEILTAKIQHPNPSWLRFVVSSKAKYRITRWLRGQQREESLTLGRELLEGELRKRGQGLVLADKPLQKAMVSLNLPTVEEMLHQVGIATLAPGLVVHRMFPELAPKLAQPVLREKAERGGERRGGLDKLNLVGLMPNMVVHAARCCSPVPGDTIMGIITTGKGITVHIVDCPNLIAMAGQPDRLLDEIEWLEVGERLHPTRLCAMVRNQKGMLTKVSQVINDAKANVLEVRMRDRDREPCVLYLEVEVVGRRHLDLVMQRIRGTPMVLDVERVRG